MQKIKKCARKRCRAGLTGLMALLLGMATPLQAVEVDGLYNAEVAVDPTDPDSRDTAYERALRQVLVRVTGSEDAAASPELIALFPNAARFVLQYRPADDNKLWVALDGAAIESVLRQRGFPVWGNERPLTVVWLAVDWGRGDRELLVAEAAETAGLQDARAMRRAALRNQIKDVATRRGLPLRFPDAADVEMADISLSDVWGGFHDPLIELSRQYSAVSVLVGRARPDDPYRSRWNYYAGGTSQQWNGSVEEATNLLADTLARDFTVSGNEALADVELSIGNVRSMAAYARVQRLVEDLPVIDDYRIKAVDGDEVRYAIRVNGGARRLSTALDFSSELEPVAAGQGTGSADNSVVLYYAYRP